MSDVTPIHLDPEHAAALRALRRDLHAHPELGYAEHHTAAVVAGRLEAAGLEVETGVAQTGVVGVLEGGRPGPTLGYRADMDALPIEEQSDAPYRSCYAGRMHACGHDVHTAIGVGVAELLARHRAQVAGRRVFIFQPNEEGAPGAGLSGGDAVVASGVLERRGVEGVLALHCMPSLEVGHIGYCPRAVWAGSDRLLIEVRGEQTHAAYPHLGADAVTAAAQIIVGLQGVAARVIDAQRACVLSIACVRAGEQFNVIPEVVTLEGVLRTLDDDVRARATVAVERLATHTAAALGAQARVTFHQGARPVINDPALLTRTLSALRARTAPGCVVEVDPQMGAEDFAAFSARLPCVYLLLGVRNEARGIVHGLHSPRFDVDEACIPLAVQAMAGALAALDAAPRGR